MIIHQTSNSRGNYNYNAFIYKKTQWAPHFHKNFELIYAISNNVTTVINGNAINLNQGEFLLVSPYTVHSLDISESSRIWVGVFAEDYILSFAKKHGNFQYSKFSCSKKVESFLKDFLIFEGTPEKYVAKSCLYMLCNECLKNAKPLDSDTPPDFKGRCISYISENLSNEISLFTISAEFGYEYHYFSALFHKCFEMNLKAFINLFRINLACELLLDKTQSISCIAGECGFSSIRNFNRVFKKLNGKTPNEYRCSMSV